MELGGAYAVRAYPEGEAYGDEGYVATLEGRLWLPKVWSELPGRMQLVGFFDTGWVQFYNTPWLAGPNSTTRSGAGVGLTWVANNNFVARVSYAHIVGTGAATSSRDTSGQFWFELVKFF
jgi:hemolysin activation/secretion protein